MPKVKWLLDSKKLVLQFKDIMNPEDYIRHWAQYLNAANNEPFADIGAKILEALRKPKIKQRSFKSTEEDLANLIFKAWKKIVEEPENLKEKEVDKVIKKVWKTILKGNKNNDTK